MISKIRMRQNEYAIATNDAQIKLTGWGLYFLLRVAVLTRTTDDKLKLVTCINLKVLSYRLIIQFYIWHPAIILVALLHMHARNG